MASDTEDEVEEQTSGAANWQPLLVVAGMICLFIGMLVLVFAGVFSGGSASGGAVIFIGPFPIAFGAGPDAGLLVLIGVVIAAVSVALTYIMWRRQRA